MGEVCQERGSDSELIRCTGAHVDIQSNLTAYYKQEKHAVSLPWDPELPAAAYYSFSENVNMCSRIRRLPMRMVRVDLCVDQLQICIGSKFRHLLTSSLHESLS